MKNEVSLKDPNELKESNLPKTINITKVDNSIKNEEITQLITQVKEELSYKLDQAISNSSNKVISLENEMKTVNTELKNIHQSLNQTNNSNTNNIHLESQIQNLHLEVIRQSQLLQVNQF